jgi:hypothetical protein
MAPAPRPPAEVPMISAFERRRRNAEYAKRRRERLAREGNCINGPAHPTPRPGYKKCDACLIVHAVSRDATRYA